MAFTCVRLCDLPPSSTGIKTSVLSVCLSVCLHTPVVHLCARYGREGGGMDEGEQEGGEVIITDVSRPALRP